MLIEAIKQNDRWKTAIKISKKAKSRDETLSNCSKLDLYLKRSSSNNSKFLMIILTFIK